MTLQIIRLHLCRCPSYQAPASCTLVPSPEDPTCCKIPKCVTSPNVNFNTLPPAVVTGGIVTTPAPLPTRPTVAPTPGSGTPRPTPGPNPLNPNAPTPGNFPTPPVLTNPTTPRPIYERTLGLPQFNLYRNAI